MKTKEFQAKFTNLRETARVLDAMSQDQKLIAKIVENHGYSKRSCDPYDQAKSEAAQQLDQQIQDMAAEGLTRSQFSELKEIKFYTVEPEAVGVEVMEPWSGIFDESFQGPNLRTQARQMGAGEFRIKGAFSGDYIPVGFNVIE